MAVQRRGNVKSPESSAIEKKIKRANAQRQAFSWRSYYIILLLLLTAITAALTWLYLSLSDDITETLVSRGEILTEPRIFLVQCSEDYENHKRFPGCTPKKCGRAVSDRVVTKEEAQILKRLAERGLSLGGSDGGTTCFSSFHRSRLLILVLEIYHPADFTSPSNVTYLIQASILDLHSGALSMGKKFVNIYRYFSNQIRDVFTEEDFKLYRDVRGRIQKVIAETFGLDSSRMYLTKPTFFSRINSTSAKTTHDEYWHPHIDKVTYGSFDYTSLLYLTDYGVDFGGGRFIFMDSNSNRTVEPRAGRVSFFSSGSENLHRVEKVVWGTRYAITVSFTCDPDHGIADPTLL